MVIIFSLLYFHEIIKYLGFYVGFSLEIFVPKSFNLIIRHFLA